MTSETKREPTLIKRADISVYDSVVGDAAEVPVSSATRALSRLSVHPVARS
jgi:hypothetical protein